MNVGSLPGRGAAASVAAARVRPEEVLQSLVELFLDEGFRQFTLADLAARAHCSKSTLYALGQSKERVTANVVRHFFREAAVQVAAEVRAEATASEQLNEYLAAIGRALRPASSAFMADLAAHDAAAEVYQRRTAAATERAREIISKGVRDGEFREVHASFVADAIATSMIRIQTGDVLGKTGLSDADAYEQLAAMVIDGIRGERAR